MAIQNGYFTTTKQAGLDGSSNPGTANRNAAYAYMNSPSYGDGGFQQGFKMGWATTDTIGSTWLAYREAKYEKKLMKMQEDLANLQATEYQTAAEDTMSEGQRQAAAIGFQAAQAKSNARVSQGASGVRVAGSGSSAEVLTSIDIVKEMQVNQVMANAVAEAWGYRKSAVAYKNQALAFKCAASQISPWAAAISTFAVKSMEMMNDGQSTGSNGQSQQGGFDGSSMQNIMSMFGNIGQSGSGASGYGLTSGGASLGSGSSFGLSSGGASLGSGASSFGMSAGGASI